MLRNQPGSSAPMSQPPTQTPRSTSSYITKTRGISQMLMKNSPRVDEDPLKKHGVVYRIICPEDGCTHSYIGMTTTRLSKRLSVHLQEGNFHQHYTRTHGELLRTTLLQAISIRDCPRELPRRFQSISGLEDREDVASQNIPDLPAAPLRRSARIRQLAATQ